MLKRNEDMLLLLAMPVVVVSGLCAIENAKSKRQVTQTRVSKLLRLALFRVMQLSLLSSMLRILLISILLRLCGSVRLLNIKSSLRLRMLLAKLLLLDKQTHNQTQRCKTHVHDPHGMQALCECVLGNQLLCSGKVVDELGVGTRTASCQFCGVFWAECCYETSGLCVHLVLVYDLADDDGDGREDLADEAESCGGCGDVSGLDIGLECDQGGLEVGTCIPC
jgi:hypothetical protein